MNDDFLTHYRPAVRPEFAQTLEERLRKQARKRVRDHRILASIIVIALTLGTLMLVPETRAAVLKLMHEVGQMRIAECTYEECAQLDAYLRLQREPNDELTTSVRPGPSDTYTISLEAIRAAYPAVDDFLPAWVPEGFTLMDDLVRVDSSGRSASIIWSAGVTPEEQSTAAFIGFSIWNEETPLFAKQGTLQEIVVDGHPAALFELHAGSDEAPYYGLNWRQNELHYSLAWPAGRVATDDVLRMAASVPEDGQLPVPPDKLDDLLRAFLAEQQ
jgi:hypothetical protein